MIVDDELLRQPLGDVRHAAVVADENLDLLAGHRVAVLRHVELDAGDDLLAGGADRAGHRHDEADLDRVLGGGAAGAQRGGGDCQTGHCEIFVKRGVSAKHGVPPHVRSLPALND